MRGNNGEQTLSEWLKFSCFKGSGHWLAGSGGHFYGKFAFRTSTEYRAALRMRLLLPLASSDVVHGGAVLCKCGKEINLSTAPLHPLDCMRSQWYWIQRHNATRDLLKAFLKDHSNLHLYQIMEEPEVTAPGVVSAQTTEVQIPARRACAMSIAEWREHRHGGGVIRADVGRFSVHGKQYFDVGVVDPTAVSYRVAEQEELLGGDVENGMTAAAAMEGGNAVGVLGGRQQATADSPAVLSRVSAKKAIYRTVLGALVDNTDRMVIFIVEATGRLSTTSARILRGLATESRDRVAMARFVEQVGAITARYNAQLILAWERHMIARPI